MSSFCNLCNKDPDTGEYFCVRLGGKWVGECPNFPDGYPWDAEREAGQNDEENENEE